MNETTQVIAAAIRNAGVVIAFAIITAAVMRAIFNE